MNYVKRVTRTTETLLLTQIELASYLGLDVKDVIKLTSIYDGDKVKTFTLPYIKVGNIIYYSRNAVDKWLTNNVAYSTQ